MRATEFIAENAEGSILPGVADALPSTFVMPELKSQDPYLQYRFGLALAAARAQAAGETTYDAESKFGEDMVIVARSKEEEETLRMAMALFGKMNSSKLVSTRPSEESSDVYHQSPLPKRVKKP
jgi:hypothetical protein